jgi:alkanesulfonate monooxygenase SsuD/methylene tetrahydromethanopterin reductase-like flavin-dependent oxidoreductase (luciferase family)
LPEFNLSLDMRAPDLGTPAPTLYAAALEMAQYCDSRGIAYATVMEHHGASDGYLPVPFVMGAAIAARTRRLRIQLGAIILPLHDPVEVAEQIAVLDLISNGRLDVVLGAGYVRSEFAMFRASLSDRARALDEGIAILQRALVGERFESGGREIFVRPLPMQKPHPPLYVGGGVPATARRAARFGAGLYPLTPEIIPLYRDECARLGRAPGPIVQNLGWIHVSEDPDRTWQQVGPHVLHVARSYAEWTEGAASSSPFAGIESIEAVKQAGLYRVVTPDECLALCVEADAAGAGFGVAPLIGGLDPEVGWRSLELLVEKVLPRVSAAFQDGRRR